MKITDKTSEPPPEGITTTMPAEVRPTTPSFNASVAAMRPGGNVDLPAINTAAWRDFEAGPTAAGPPNPAGEAAPAGYSPRKGDVTTFDPTCGGGKSLVLTCEAKITVHVCP